ncbi:MAG: hypothetical protein ACHQ53_08170 [Polyangiales bacterium]
MSIKQLTTGIVLGFLLIAPAVALPLSARIGQDLTQALRAQAAEQCGAIAAVDGRPAASDHP